MNTMNPIYTQKTECQDCYKCVRRCHFKAIKIEDGHAIVIPSACVLCGHCVEVCPARAKRVRNDLVRADFLLKSNRRVIASLAPSYIAEFGADAAKIPHYLKALGFFGVSETALGAELVSAALPSVLKKGRVNITSACPVVVEMVEKYYPHLTDRITPLLSPALAHAKELKKQFGSDTEVVFIGPCIAKKKESDSHPDLISLSLSFLDLAEMIKGVRPDTESDPFVTERSSAGNLYPVDGGLLYTLRRDCSLLEEDYISLSGISEIRMALESLEKVEDGRTVVMELLACKGGCVNGPLCASKDPVLARRRTVLAVSGGAVMPELNPDPASISESYAPAVMDRFAFSEDELRAQLRSIGKTSEEDMLNCGGCGYDSCREFASAMLSGKAERSMCVSYMRRLAQKKANALIKSMPSGVVIVDENMKVIECNVNFAHQMLDESDLVFSARPGLEGASLEKILPKHVCDMFREVIASGAGLSEKDARIGSNFFHCTVFSIEKNHASGGIFQDVTSPMMRKKIVVERTRQVISKNLETVQTIAALLGENAASTEVLLNSIMESYRVSGDEHE
jgi:iron only hydrogenase large subunit-like protein